MNEINLEEVRAWATEFIHPADQERPMGEAVLALIDVTTEALNFVKERHCFACGSYPDHHNPGCPLGRFAP